MTLDKNIGNTTVRTTDGSLLPDNLPLNFVTAEGNTSVASGNYVANIAITTTIK
ncbi:CS3 fimbrial subunit A [Kosakonia sp. MUSA4]|nr:CS3 fimbrial subunit A [Kosakonia sp. MUSA4]